MCLKCLEEMHQMGCNYKEEQINKKALYYLDEKQSLLTAIVATFHYSCSCRDTFVGQ